MLIMRLLYELLRMLLLKKKNGGLAQAFQEQRMDRSPSTPLSLTLFLSLSLSLSQCIKLVGSASQVTAGKYPSCHFSTPRPASYSQVH